MNRLEILIHNQKVIEMVKKWLKERELQHRQNLRLRRWLPRMGYKELALRLNAGNIQTSRGNSWTFRSLYRMMQRQGVRLHDINHP